MQFPSQCCCRKWRYIISSSLFLFLNSQQKQSLTQNALSFFQWCYFVRIKDDRKDNNENIVCKMLSFTLPSFIFLLVISVGNSTRPSRELATPRFKRVFFYLSYFTKLPPEILTKYAVLCQGRHTKPFSTDPPDLQVGLKELGYSTVTVVKMLSYLTMVSFRGIPHGQSAGISPLILSSIPSLHLSVYIYIYATFTISSTLFRWPIFDLY